MRTKSFIALLACLFALNMVQAQDVIIRRNTTTANKSVVKPLKTNVKPTNSLDNVSFKTFSVNGVSFKMIQVEGGTFTMGGTDDDFPEEEEKPTHSVTLSSYYIGETEVTQALWEAVMGTTILLQREKLLRNQPQPEKYPIKEVGTTIPMYYVSWDDCQVFIQKLDSLTGLKFRLPTEAEWEYAARGGKYSRNYSYSGGNLYSLRKVMWCDDYKEEGPHPVKKKQPNELGIYDMSGNVSEWCQDWYGPYNASSQTNPIGPESGSKRVTRGGDWITYPHGCRVSFRREDMNYKPSYSYYRVGFRLAL